MRARTVSMLLIGLLLLHDIGCMPPQQSAGSHQKVKKQSRKPWNEVKHAMGVLQALEEAGEKVQKQGIIDRMVGQRTVTGGLVQFFTRPFTKSVILGLMFSLGWLFARPDKYEHEELPFRRIIKAFFIFFVTFVIGRVLFSKFVFLTWKRSRMDLTQQSVCQMTYAEDTKESMCNFEPYDALGLQQRELYKHEFEMFTDAIDTSHPDASDIISELSDDIIENNPVEHALKRNVEGNIAFLCQSRNSLCPDTGVLVDTVPAAFGTDADCPFLLAVHGKGEQYGLVGKWSSLVQVGMELNPEVFHGRSQFIGAAVAVCLRIASEGSGGTKFTPKSPEAIQLLYAYSFSIRKCTYPRAMEVIKDRYMMLRRPVRTHFKPNRHAGVKSGTKALPTKRLGQDSDKVGTFLAIGTAADGTALKTTMFHIDEQSVQKYRKTTLGSKFANHAIEAAIDSENWAQGAMRGNWWCTIMNKKLEFDNHECSYIDSRTEDFRKCQEHHSALKMIERLEETPFMASVDLYHNTLSKLEQWSDTTNPKETDPRWDVELVPFFSKLIDPTLPEYGRGRTTWDRLLEWDVWFRAHSGLLTNSGERRPWYRFGRNDQPPVARTSDDVEVPLLPYLNALRDDEKAVLDRLKSTAVQEMLFPFKYVVAMDDVIDQHCTLDETKGRFVNRHDHVVANIPFYAPLNKKLTVKYSTDQSDEATMKQSPLFALFNVHVENAKAANSVMKIMAKSLDNTGMKDVAPGTSYGDLLNDFQYNNLLSSIVRAQICGAEANMVYMDAAIIGGLTAKMGKVLMKYNLPQPLEGESRNIFARDMMMSARQFRDGAFMQSFEQVFALFFAMSAVWSLANKRKSGVVMSREDREYIAYSILGTAPATDQQYHRNTGDVEDFLAQLSEEEDLIAVSTYVQNWFLAVYSRGKTREQPPEMLYVAKVAKAAVAMITEPPHRALLRYGLKNLPLL